MPQQSIKRLNVDLLERQHKEIKVYAAQKGVTVTALLLALLEREGVIRPTKG